MNIFTFNCNCTGWKLRHSGQRFFRFASVAVSGSVLLFSAVVSGSTTGRPRVLTTADQRTEILERIEQNETAAEAYRELKERVRPLVERHVDDSEWFISRMPMNWDTHYTTDLIKNQAWAGGEGRAPVPTPRFQGMRRHLRTSHGLPTDPAGERFAEMRPYGDKGGLIWARNRAGEWEWTEPKNTRQSIGTLWSRIMDLARDAAFIYWLEGDEATAYADFASDILWTFMHGFSYKEKPRVIDDDGYQRRILTLTSLQCVGADAFGTSMCAAYDYLYDHLRDQGRDTRLIERQLMRMADKVIKNGFSGPHNWNISQNSRVASVAMTLSRRRERARYLDIVLNADQSRQTGLLKEVEDGMCSVTGLWPEHSYGIGVPGGIMRVALQLSNERAAVQLLNHPSLQRVVFSQYNLTYPNGLTPGTGVGGSRPLNADLAEYRLAWALEQGDRETAIRLAAILKREIESGRYEREKRGGLDAIIRDYPELPEEISWREIISPTATFYAPPLNIMMMRNLPSDGGADHAIAAALYGSKGTQSHSNGLAIELYGAGHILGVDPGIGPRSRHDPSQEYYGGAAAHNTVIVNGRSRGGRAMEVTNVQPAVEKQIPASRVALIYAQGELSYQDPAAFQERTLALVRIDDETAFFFDVFRSRRDRRARRGRISRRDRSDAEEYHDYLYQNRSTRMMLNDAAGTPLLVRRSQLLTSENGNLTGYDYFENEKSVLHEGDIRVQWPWRPPGGGEVIMDMWMLGNEDRRVFQVDAPNMRGARGPMRKLVVRQHGEAWDRPFVAVYAPRHSDQPEIVRSVETVGTDAWRVFGEDWSVKLELDGRNLTGNLRRR